MSHTLVATKRELRGERLRHNTGELPAVVYGAGSVSESLSLNGAEFLKLYRAAGESSLVDLQISGKDTGKVLIQEIQLDPVSGMIIHVDLRRIDMNKAMTATVELKFVGEAPVVKAQGGTLVMNVHSVEVKCLPKDLVSNIEIDLSNLNSFDEVIKVKDLKIPAGITITKPNLEDVIAKASRALTEDELKALEEKNASLDVSKIESAKPEKVAEEGAEGAAPAAGAAAPAAAKKEEKK